MNKYTLGFANKELAKKFFCNFMGGNDEVNLKLFELKTAINLYKIYYLKNGAFDFESQKDLIRFVINWNPCGGSAGIFSILDLEKDWIKDIN